MKRTRIRLENPGLWSRRVSHTHRLADLVRDDRIDFLRKRRHD
ncbi:type II toxin-antitoxin system YoeB family toxin [Desulfomicrobium macestii]|nr:type II toxin-antitoxin system YoeB family toxin [Desulfomicrobium macestii]